MDLAESKIIEADQDNELIQQLEIRDYKARIERLVILIEKTCDWNCAYNPGATQ